MGPPHYETKVSTAGWVTFVVLLVILCWPFCWIGLLMKDRIAIWSACHIRLER